MPSMHAPAGVSSSQFGEPERIRHVTPRRLVWLALLAYGLLALALFSSTWVDPAGSWIGSPKDPKLFIWYLGWIPHELARGHNPLFTDYLSYPDGVNLMWNTSMIFPALVLWPVTATFGPVVAYNVLITSGIALSAWLGFLAARRFIDQPLLCLAAGLIYGFSPALVAQALGHPHVVVALFPPIAFLLGHELLVTTLLIALIGVLLLALLHRDQVSAALPHAMRAAGAALVAFAILAGYPLAFQFFGPQRVYGDVQQQDVYVSDLLAFVAPSNLILFTGNIAENDAYVGVPLAVLFAAGTVVGWRRARIRWTGLTASIVALLSLGPHLHVNGTVTPVWLPWAAVAQLPLMGSALPARLMVVGFLGVGFVAAAAVVLKTAQPWRIGSGVALIAGRATIAPSLPYPSAIATVPAFFKPGGGVERLAPGSVLIVTPFSSKQSTDAMLWQAVANYRFRMPEGDAFTPGPYLGPRPTFMQFVYDGLAT